MTKFHKLSKEDWRKVFDCVGFTFLNKSVCAWLNHVDTKLCSTRMHMHTRFADRYPDNALDCPENPYHKIAVTILVCFSTDEQLDLNLQIFWEMCFFSLP